ncbi:cytochrome P450 [Xylariomycetidae sp. FL2044]|nr:cytochrome P450 [Xylariomycetidae sp. FL2044]
MLRLVTNYHQPSLTTCRETFNVKLGMPTAMATLLLNLTIGLGAIAILWHVVRWSRRPGLPLPPGPPPLPILGNLLQAPKSHSWLRYHTWSQAYGPVMHLNMLGQPIIILSSSKAAQDLLAKRGARYSDRPRSVMAAELALKGQHILLRPYDARFKLHQRLQAPFLNAQASKAYQELQDLESRHLLFDFVSKCTDDDAGIDCHPVFERTTASTIYALTYGYRLMTGLEPELALAHDVQEEFTSFAQVGAYMVDTFPVLNHLPAVLAPWKQKAEHQFGRQCGLHVGNLKRGLDAEGWNFSKQMQKSIPVEAADMSTEELAFNLGIMADAALDTTTMTMDWLVVAWITEGHRFVKKAQGYLDQAVGRDRLPTYHDRPKLPYVDAIVEEVLRWRPIGAGGVPHMTKVEDSYEGCRIPAGSVVVANHWALAREPAVFGEDVEAFIPERWLTPGGGVETSGSSVLGDLPTIGFGFGRRICPGRHIARNSLWLQIARLLWAFDIEAGLSETGENLVVDSMAATDGLTSRPLAFKAVFKPRGPCVHKLIEKSCNTGEMDVTAVLDKIGQDLAAKH